MSENDALQGFLGNMEAYERAGGERPPPKEADGGKDGEGGGGGGGKKGALFHD